ncbi:MAG: rhodanese-like domain-containing protein [bacterium]|nr:hypothetical protein [Myxococcales bacterium]MCB9552363.1 hypothetical protein [Myxococcales bacterium]
MTRIFTAALLALGFTLGGASVALACNGHEATAAAPVDAATLASWIEKKETKVFHAADAATFAAGTLPTAVRVDYTALDAATLGADKDARMTFLCGSSMCGASKKAAMAAMELGYTNVHVFKEGIAGWKAAGKELVVAQAPKAAKVKADG